MTEKIAKPQLRFAGFDDTWEQRKFEDIAVRSSSISSESGLPRVEYEDIISGTGRLNKDIFSKESDKTGIVFHKGDVLYGKLRPYLQNWLLPSFNGLAVGDFWVLQPQNADSSFLYRLIQSRQFDEVANQSTGTKMPRSDWKLVSKTEFFIPSAIGEQAAIGAYFEQLDNLITLHQRKYDKLTNVKKSMLEKMFPKNGSNVPEIRFKGFSDAWEQRKLSDIADKVTEKNGGLQYIETFTNSAEYGIISQRDYFDHDIAKIGSLDGYYIVRNEDFVYNPRISTSAPVGPINRNKLGRTGVMSPLYTVFRPHDVDTTYLEHFFKSKYWHSFMNFNGDSGARSDRFSIKDSVFFEMPVPIPHIEEQRKIGECLTNIDNLITLHQRELEKLKNLKKACLEKMFV
ncbi:MAG: restriction endonuclease subunit S [Subdoligranulum sp.]|nr:restriction endonuclease subunit S [Subdoligranulum sp.]